MMRSKRKRLVASLCCLFLLWIALCPAQAEDCFTLDVDALDMNRLNNNDYVAQNLTARAKGLCVQKYISDSSELAVPVRLSLMRMDTQTLLMDKDYGYQSKDFDSGVIYLTYSGSGVIPYLVTLYVGDMVYAMPFMQLQPRLEYNSACTYGPRLRDLGLASDWLMGTMLDLNQLRTSGYATADICASNAYVIGQAVVQMQNEALCVQLELNGGANVEILGLSLYVVTDCALLTADPAACGLAAVSPGQWVDVSGAASAFLYMPMQVSYDPAGLNPFGYDLNSSSLQGQLALWNQNRSGPAAPLMESTPVPEETWPTWPDAGEASGMDAFTDPSSLPAAEPTAVPDWVSAPPETILPDAALPETASQDAVGQEAASQDAPTEAILPDAAVFGQAAPETAPVQPTVSPTPTPLPQPNGNAGFEG